MFSHLFEIIVHSLYFLQIFLELESPIDTLYFFGVIDIDGGYIFIGVIFFKKMLGEIEVNNHFEETILQI